MFGRDVGTRRRHQWGWPPASRSRACGGDREHDLEALDRAARRAGQVADQRLAPGARDAARQHAEAAAAAVARPPDRLDDARRLALDDGAGALGREVAGAEAGAAGRDDQAREPVGELARARPRPPRRRRRRTRCVDDLVAGRGRAARRARARSCRRGCRRRRRRRRSAPWPASVTDDRVADRARARRPGRRRRRCRCPTRGCRRRPRPRDARCRS